MDERRLLQKTCAGFAQLALMMALLLFVPAGTLHYWQAWAFLAVFLGASLAITAYLFRHDRELLERRLRAGPSAETEASQKIIQAFAGLVFIAALVVPALDHRFGWSHLPLPVVLAGDVLVALGFLIVFRVFRVNTFTASTIEVAAEQQVITTGPYALVRHPMYAGALLLFLGIPLALGSLWGLLVFVPALLVLVWRLVDEEKFLVDNLAGYEAYRRKTRYRLIPHIW